MPMVFFLPALLLQYQLTGRVNYSKSNKEWFNNEDKINIRVSFIQIHKD